MRKERTTVRGWGGMGKPKVRVRDQGEKKKINKCRNRGLGEAPDKGKLGQYEAPSTPECERTEDCKVKGKLKILVLKRTHEQINYSAVVLRSLSERMRDSHDPSKGRPSSLFILLG